MRAWMGGRDVCVCVCVYVTQVTSYTATAMTVVRGVGGTVALAHSLGQCTPCCHVRGELSQRRRPLYIILLLFSHRRRLHTFIRRRTCACFTRRYLGLSCRDRTASEWIVCLRMDRGLLVQRVARMSREGTDVREVVVCQEFAFATWGPPHARPRHHLQLAPLYASVLSSFPARAWQERARI